ncbi:MAG: ABC transporter permease, partial [Syntrophales bacterium]
MDIFKRLLQLAKPHGSKFILAMLCMLVVGATTSALAFLVKPALDEIFLKKNSDMLMWIPVAVIVIYLIKGGCNYTQ